MRTLRRLLRHLSHELDLDRDTTTLAALLSTLDHFDRYPKDYMELYRDSI